MPLGKGLKIDWCLDFFCQFFFLSIEAGDKIGLKSERKISEGTIVTVHIAGLSEFQEIRL